MIKKYLLNLIREELSGPIEHLNAQADAYRKKWSADDKAWREAIVDRQNENAKALHDYMRTDPAAAARNEALCASIDAIAEAVRGKTA